MRKNNFKMATLLLAGCLMANSCIGSFSLFNKYAEWQRTMSDSKILNAVVGFVLMPIVGSITLFIDSIVLNTIEFWTGENPIAGNIGKTRQVMGGDGRYYAVKTLKDGYEITTPDGGLLKLVYDKKNDAWMQVAGGEAREIFRFNPDGTVKVTTQAGEKLDVSLDEGGLYKVRMAAGAGNYWALK